MVLIDLFLSFMKIGLASVGGGYAAIRLIEEEIVKTQGWLTSTEFYDICAIAEMTPGPVAVNASTFTGIQMASLPGAVAATAGCMLLPFLIVMILSYIYKRYHGLDVMKRVFLFLRPATISMVIAAGAGMLISTAFPSGGTDVISVILFIASAFVLRMKIAGPLPVMAGAGLAGLILYGIF